MALFSQKGYYSLIQYCPDRTRMETANVGVLLFSPGWSFLDIRLTSSFARIKGFFRGTDFDAKRLQATLESFRQRIEGARQQIRTEEDLVLFIGTRANEIVLTPPRPIKVGNPTEELDGLCQELFGRRSPEPQHKVPLIPELDSVFRRPSLQGRARFNVPVTVPLLGESRIIPYAFNNGAENLVCPEVLSRAEGHSLNKAERLALEGDLIQRHPENGHGRKVIVVLQVLSGETPEYLLDRVRDLLEEYKVRVVCMAALGEFANEVEASAH